MQTIWFILWGVLWAVYFALDGFDLGVGTLLPFLAKNEEEKRSAYAAIGPYWDGNEVWLIAAGGVTFAAFPEAYATMFSALYSALMLLLFALILRGAAVALREESESAWAKKAWDALFVAGSFLPALLLGVAFANIFMGIPIDGEGISDGTILTLLNFYGLLGGLLFLLFFLVHGCLWLAVKTEGEMAERAAALAGKLWYALVSVVVAFLIVTWFQTRLYDNYLSSKVLFVIPLLAAGCLAGVFLLSRKGQYFKAWLASGVAIISCVMFGVAGLYPVILPSSLSRDYDVTIYNASSSPLTLKIMLGVTLVLLPLVIAYQVWTYYIFKGKVEGEQGY